MIYDNKHKKIMTYTALAVIVTIVLGVLAWGFDRGFLLTDGGHYVLRYQELQPTDTNTWILEHVLVKALVPPCLRTIESLRYLAFFLNLISTTIFGLALYRSFRIIHGQNMNPALLSLMMLAGFVLSYPGLPSELSYNSLSQFFLVNASSLLLMALLGNGWRSVLMAGLAGLICSFLFFVKMPAGLSYFLLVVLVSFMAGKRVSLLAYMVAFIVIVLVIWSTFSLDGSWFVGNLNQMLTNTNKNHFLIRIKAPLLLLWTLTKVFLATFLASVALWRYGNTKGKSLSQVLSLCVFVFIITVFVAYQIMQNLLGNYITSDFLAMPIFLIGFTLLLREGGIHGIWQRMLHYVKTGRVYLAVLVLLLIAPYAGAFGSWVELNLIAKYFLVSLLGLIALILPWLKKPLLSRLAAGLSLYLVLMGLWHYVQYPFGYGPLYNLTTEYKGIKYEPEMARHLYHIDKVLKDKGFSPDQGIIAPLSPGLVYLMGSYQPGGVLWSDNYLEDYLANLSRTNMSLKPVIISHTWGLRPEFIKGLFEATGIDFNRDYQLVDSNISSMGTTNIYFPISVEIEEPARKKR